ncbi:MAG: hypothetical protein H6738_09675 [Alphaproteobacteria bacterium]|nr:hypothetical protein [Alphaproteobacteria bacterium]MCB9697034.1 hypothetical protein [Alphaproteobacteria bacterium]
MSDEGSPPRPSAAAVYGQLAAGILLTLVTNALLGGALVAGGLSLDGFALHGSPNPVGGFLLSSGLAIGLTQWAWLTPVGGLLLFRWRALGLGMWIGGALVAMLNGSCALTMFGVFTG